MVRPSIFKLLLLAPALFAALYAGGAFTPEPSLDKYPGLVDWKRSFDSSKADLRAIFESLQDERKNKMAAAYAAIEQSIQKQPTRKSGWLITRAAVQSLDQHIEAVISREEREALNPFAIPANYHSGMGRREQEQDYKNWRWDVENLNTYIQLTGDTAVAIRNHPPLAPLYAAIEDSVRLEAAPDLSAILARANTQWSHDAKQAGEDWRRANAPLAASPLSPRTYFGVDLAPAAFPAPGAWEYGERLYGEDLKIFARPPRSLEYLTKVSLARPVIVRLAQAARGKDLERNYRHRLSAWQSSEDVLEKNLAAIAVDLDQLPDITGQVDIHSTLRRLVIENVAPATIKNRAAALKSVQRLNAALPSPSSRGPASARENLALEALFTAMISEVGVKTILYVVPDTFGGLSAISWPSPAEGGKHVPTWITKEVRR